MSLVSLTEDIENALLEHGARGYINRFIYPSPTYATKAPVELPSPISKKIALRPALVEALDLHNLRRRFARKCAAPNSSIRVVMTSQRAVIVQTIKRRIPAYTPPRLDPPTWSARH
jgi:hypothetical protein